MLRGDHPVLHVDERHSVCVGLLGGGKGNQRTAVADRFCTHMLRLMEMTQCNIDSIWRKNVVRHRMLAAYKDAALRALRFRSAAHVQMTECYEREACKPRS